MRDRGEFGPRVADARRFEGNGAGENAPVDLRQRDMHREIRRPKSALRGAPGVEAHAREHDLQDRGIKRVERRSLFFIKARGEGGGVEDDVKAPALEKRAQRLQRRLILEAGQEDARDRKAFVAERPGERCYWLKIAREIDRAIEDDEGAEGVRTSLETGAVEAAKGADGDGRRSLRGGADLAREKGEARRHIVGAALVEIAPDAQGRVLVERRSLVEARIAATISRQQRQFDAAAARERMELVNSVAPIIRAAEHARDHELGPRAHSLQIEVDRERMAQGG